jgi:hypothetical protein
MITNYSSISRRRRMRWWGEMGGLRRERVDTKNGHRRMMKIPSGVNPRGMMRRANETVMTRSWTWDMIITIKRLDKTSTTTNYMKKITSTHWVVIEVRSRQSRIWSPIMRWTWTQVRISLHPKLNWRTGE